MRLGKGDCNPHTHVLANASDGFLSRVFARSAGGCSTRPTNVQRTPLPFLVLGGPLSSVYLLSEHEQTRPPRLAAIGEDQSPRRDQPNQAGSAELGPQQTGG